MKICSLVLSKTQVYDPFGSVCLCCFADSTVGRLTENTLEEIWRGEKTKNFFKRLSQQDYSMCNKSSCPYWASGRNEVPLMEIDAIPDFPQALSLSYEKACNYRCTVCRPAGVGNSLNETNDRINRMRETIEKNLESALPHLKNINANGRGELFVSKNILRLLANWRPISPIDELSVSLETNGSLFDEKHWKQIENLGQYNLRVAITVMSFDEHVYQTLSGTRLPISKLEDNLRFVKSLREKGIINHLQIATVIQERNFRMLPEFTRRCIEEFGADSIRLRPYVPYDPSPQETKYITDIKNVNHPYHDEYVQILKDPIFNHPKVDNWGTLSESYSWDLPYKSALGNEVNLRRAENQALIVLMTKEAVFGKLKLYLQRRGKRNFLLFGTNALGVLIAKKLVEIGCNVNYMMDFDVNGSFGNISIVTPDKVPPPTSRRSYCLHEFAA